MSSQRSKPWSQTTLGKSLPIRYGKARTDKAGVAREDSPVYGSSGVIDKFDRALTNGPALIIGRKGTVGATHYSSEPCWPIDTVYFAEPSEGKDLRFFKHLLDHLQLGRMDRSTAVPGLSRDDYNAREVAIPEIDEQRRIVAEIEKQFTRLEAGVSALRRVQANLKRYRAAVLKAACEGRLVSTEVELTKTGSPRAKSKTGDELLARILTERRKNWQGRGQYKAPAAPDTTKLPAIPEGWTWVSVETIGFVTKLAGFEYTKYVKYSPGGDLAVIKAENAGRSGFKRTEISRIKSSTVAQLTRSQLKAGDLLMVFVGAGTGNVARVPDDQPYFLGPNIAMIRVGPRDVSGAYLEMFLRSPVGHSLTFGFIKAVAQPSLSMGTIRMIPVALPPLAEQTRIVAEVERRLSVVEEMEMVVRANLKRTNRLRQSILQRAFSEPLS
jgi:type I restriction enzyme, S subunit